MTKDVHLKGNVTLSPHLYIGILLQDFTIEFDYVYDSQIGSIVKWEGNLLAKVINSIIAA